MNNTLTEEQKKEVTAKVATAAKTGAKKAAEQAKKSTGWKKWVWIGLAVALGGVAVFAETGCEQITPAQMQKAGRVVHAAYHLAHPEKPCILPVPVEDDGK